MNKLNEIIEKFNSGKIGIFPTDTAYGIGCRMDNEKSLKKIYTIRNRPKNKPLLVLVNSVEMVEKYAHLNAKIKRELIEKYWPGGLTIILKCKKDKVPSIVRSEGESLAVRMPDHKELLKIIEKVGVPIVAPSANFSGKKTPVNLSDVDKKLISKVDFVIQGMCTMNGVSTIIDTTVTPWKIMRKGVINIEV